MIEKLKKYSKEKLLLYSANNDEGFYSKESFFEILKKGRKSLVYAQLLLMDQNEYNLSNKGLGNRLKEIHSLFYYLEKTNNINKIKEIRFYEAPDFLIIMNDNSNRFRNNRCIRWRISHF